MVFSKSVLEDIAELALFDNKWRNYGAVYRTAPFFCCEIGAVYRAAVASKVPLRPLTGAAKCKLQFVRY